MTIMDMLGQSGILTVLGMAIVFGFLAIMVVAVTVVGKILHALGADRDAGAAPAQAVKTTTVAAAITAAVTEYRKTEK
ncbi:MAG: OadG family protein [Treponema sp.]|jgi:oxaloacetate decarboxylase gamma subunit|nr:OadG family protein [Treponema sp.]